MKDFINQFTRDSDGAWLCIAPATLETTSGRIQVTPGSRFTSGTAFMGVDVAELLDRQASLQNTNAKASVAARGRQ